MDQTSEFLRGISGGLKKSSGNPLDFLYFVIIVGVILFIIWLINDYYKKNIKGKKYSFLKTISSIVPDMIKSTSGLNAYQRKILSDIILEFKKKEFIAEGIPSIIFEKFAEYLYYNVNRLKVSDRDVKNFIKTNYPILKGYNIEMDLQKEGVLNLISTKVIAANDKYIEVEYPVGLNFQFLKGMPVYINYNVGKHFLRGLSTIVSIKQDISLVLKKPENLTLSYERRYSRLTLKDAKGSLVNPKNNIPYDIEILDISFEGLRIASKENLQRNNVYHLSFSYVINERNFIFTNIECSLSKSFISKGGRKEYGLIFLYLNNETRLRLSSFIRELALKLQMNKGKI